MTDPKASKPASPRWLVWVFVTVVGVLAFGMGLLSSCKVKTRLMGVPYPVVLHYPPRGPSDIDVPGSGKPQEAPRVATIVEDTTPDTTFDWRYGIRWADLAAGQGYVNYKDTFGRKQTDIFELPNDLNYELELEIDSITGKLHLYTSSLTIPAEPKAILSVRFRLGAGYRPGTIDSLGRTYWTVGPQGSVGVLWEPWPWLDVIPLEATWPLGIAAGVEINLPVVRR